MIGEQDCSTLLVLPLECGSSWEEGEERVGEEEER